MKTSRLIFISFFSFIGLLLVSFLIVGFAYKDIAYIEGKAKALKFEKRKKTIKIEKQVKHIFVEDKGSITIKYGEEQSLNYFVYNIKDSLNTPKLEVKNDTLFLSAQPGVNITLTLKDVNNLKSISGVNSSVTLSGLEMPTLNLYFKNGNVNLTNNTKIKNISVTLSEKAGFDIHHNVVVDTLNLDINNSTMNFHNTNREISLFKGTIYNNSNVRIPKALHINLDVDESSKFNMR